jgi:pimeloyl-ACP methyl ester carboxylesterase
MTRACLQPSRPDGEGTASEPSRQHVRGHRRQPRWRERLGEIAVPTLVVHGDEDPFFPHGNGVALAAEIPGATLLTLPGTGQGVPRVTWPDVVEALLRHTS